MAGWEAQFGVVAGVAFAMLLGGLIGFERELKNRPAGFRTHMLVAGAAALLVGMGPLMLAPYAGGEGPVLRIDPLRLVEAVVAGQHAAQPHVLELADGPGRQPVPTGLDPRVALLLDHQDVVAGVGEPVGAGRTCGPTSDYQDIVHRVGLRPGEPR